jgi:excisionase family DNA binding protein
MQTTNEKKVLTLDEACNFTGLSKSYLYKLTSSRQVPHFKPRGKLVYFDREQLEAWLLSNPVATADQIERQADAHLIKGRK